MKEQMNLIEQLFLLNGQPINDLMDGGLGLGELGVVVAAPSGVGKTWILTAYRKKCTERFECGTLHNGII